MILYLAIYILLCCTKLFLFYFISKFSFIHFFLSSNLKLLIKLEELLANWFTQLVAYAGYNSSWVLNSCNLFLNAKVYNVCAQSTFYLIIVEAFSFYCILLDEFVWTDEYISWKILFGIIINDFHQLV